MEEFGSEKLDWTQPHLTRFRDKLTKELDFNVAQICMQRDRLVIEKDKIRQNKIKNIVAPTLPCCCSRLNI